MPTTYANSINSNPIFADRAEKDASGNVISSTYALKADGLPAKSASDAGKVLTVNSAGSASWEASKTLTAGSGISITEGSDVVTIAASVLPSYNASDAAKVLSVNSAGTGVEWAAASGGDSDIFYADDTNTSFADIASAYNSGKYVVLIVNGKILCPLIQIYDNRSMGLASTAEFMQIDPEGDSSLTTRVHKLILPDGASQYWANTVYYGVKQPTASDVGKVLSYVSGSGMSWTQIPDELPSKNASDAGKALVVNSAGTGVEWASVGGSSTITTSNPLIGDGGANNPVKLLYSNNSLETSADEYELTVGAGTYGTCGTLTAYSAAIDEISKAPVTFVFTGIPNMGFLPLAYRCYIYCATTQARIYSNYASGIVSGTLPVTLDVKNPGEGSTGTFDGYSYQYDWEVGVEINMAAGTFTGVTLNSAFKLNVKNASLLSNTAGIKNIISTAALPASPASDVLYLIPEA